MVIIYTSGTGYTEQYAKLLSDLLDLPYYRADRLPDVHKGGDIIYMGWIMAGSIVGYKHIRSICNVKCLIGVGMSPESPDMEKQLREKMAVPSDTALFYLQGGYDKTKLKGANKLIMKFVEPKILARFEGMPEEEKKKNPTYRMVTEGYSVVSKEKLDPVAAWAKDAGVK